MKWFGSLSVLAVLSGCRGQTSEEPPVLLIRNMFHQERYNPESEAPFFKDKRTMRTPPEGTVSRESVEENDEVATGLLDDGNYVPTLPGVVATRAGGMDKLLDRGRERYGIYCVPCHDAAGAGKGTVAMVQPGFPPIPAYSDERLRRMPDGQMFLTITNGVRNMPPYAAQISVADRWAIVAYVRALQLSQAKGEPKK